MLLSGNRKVGAMVGLHFRQANTLIVMAIGGALAGFAGICETSAIQGRLQSGLSVGYGLTGFLVAWLSGQHFLRAVPIAILIGGLIAAGDALQLYSEDPERQRDHFARLAVCCRSWRKRAGRSARIRHG